MDKLSPRQQQIARLLASGKTQQQVAYTLHLAPRTIHAHTARIRYKCQAETTVEAVSRIRSELTSDAVAHLVSILQK